jgi:alcohol dehydrogenase
MSHQIGGVLDVPHGIVNGVLLPHVIRFNAEQNAERLRPVAVALGLEVAGKPDDIVAEETADAVRRLAEAVGVPRTLSELGVTAQDIPRLAANTLLDACLTTNPRDATVDDISAVFHAAL